VKRISSVFKDVASKRDVGESILAAIKRHDGHKGNGVQYATIRRWAEVGFVKLKKHVDGKKIVVDEVTLTREGKRVAKAAIERAAT
jgi:hypothetical protein